MTPEAQLAMLKGYIEEELFVRVNSDDYRTESDHFRNEGAIEILEHLKGLLNK